MKILMVNKFLHPNGGSETYILKLGEYLNRIGHEVQYFGMDHEGRCVGNRVNSYTSDMDFHNGKKISKVLYPIKTIYSIEARKKIRKVLDDFSPEICHLNNFNYQLTPSIILEIKKWRRETGKTCKIIYTAHDYQLICPNHMMNIPETHNNCEKCLGGHFFNCLKNKCIHGSRIKSLIGCTEAVYWNKRGIYKNIDKIICCSEFMKSKMDTNPIFADKTLTLCNFIDKDKSKEINIKKGNYILYFGRYSDEKGVKTLIAAAERLPNIKFVFAGRGQYSNIISSVSNISDVGFKTGYELNKLIREAKFTIYPSEWYENCPFSVMESQQLGTVVLGADIGGLPELIVDGENGLLFKSGDVNDLIKKIKLLWSDDELLNKLEIGCKKIARDTVREYAQKYLECCS